VLVAYEKKLAAVETHLAGLATLRELAGLHGVHHSTIEKWIHNYRTFGREGLRRSKTRTRYTEPDKIAAVKCYYEEQQTLYGVCRKYKIHSISTLQNWIIKYEAKLSLGIGEAK